MNEPLQQSQASQRRCNACTVCCVALPIPEGHLPTGPKAAGAPCGNMITHGCGNYENRPTACRNFLCAWLADTSWPDAWRPDLAGLLCLREELEPGLVGAAAYEIRPNALQSPEASGILHTLRATTAILVTIDADGLRRTYTNLEDAPAAAASRRKTSAAA